MAEDSGDQAKPRSLLRRILAGFGLSLLLIFGWYLSLLASSEKLTYDQKQVVQRAIDMLDQQGFQDDTFILRRFVAFRASDNWWNRYVGHADAYAATNFPFEVVTLYPDFFQKTVDDTERAAVLLHESRHLAGKDEEDAFTHVWKMKDKLGWTKERYEQTRVWRNVTELTKKHAPKLFQCGHEANHDCHE